MRLDDFTRLPARARAVTVDGLSGLVDIVADGAPAEQQLRRYQWYAADLAIDGGAARTIVVEQDGDPVIAFPFTGWHRRIAMLLGPAWPARGFPARLEADEMAFDALLHELGRHVAALEIGPCDARDRALGGLLDAARRRHWKVVARDVPLAPPIAAVFRELAGKDAAIAAALADATPPADLRQWLIVRPGVAGWLARLSRAQRTTSRV